MRPWSFRRADPNDADALTKCLEAAYAPYSQTLPDLPPVADDCVGDIARLQVWVAEFEGRIVGSLMLAPDTGFMMLTNVAVHPDQQGAGLGRALIKLAEKEARGQGFGELRLNTHAGMPENIRLYERLGWEETIRSGNKVSMAKPI